LSEALNRTVEFIGDLSPWAFVLTALVAAITSILQARQLVGAMKIEEALGRRDDMKFTIISRRWVDPV
jgi:hypothetical protein